MTGLSTGFRAGHSARGSYTGTRWPRSWTRSARRPGRSAGSRTSTWTAVPPSVAVLRADRAGGDTKTPRSRRALKLAQMAAGALREWQVDQAAEQEAARSHWQDTGRVFTTATGTPLGARHIRKMFQDVCERAGFGRDWAPRDLRHTFVSLLSDDGMAIEKIARLVGHASSHVTETVYRQELRFAIAL